MAQSVSLAAMRLAARRRAGQETLDPDNAFVSDEELDVVLNDWLQHVYRALVRAKSGFYRAQQPIATTANTSLYALNLDFLQLISVDWQFSPSDVVPIYPYEESERNIDGSTTRSGLHSRRRRSDASGCRQGRPVSRQGTNQGRSKA